jgi:hypothetical protein
MTTTPTRPRSVISLVRGVLQNAERPLSASEIATHLGADVAEGPRCVALLDLYRRGEVTRELVLVGKRQRYAYRYADPNRTARRTPPPEAPRRTVDAFRRDATGPDTVALEVPANPPHEDRDEPPPPTFTPSRVTALEAALGEITRAAAAIGLRVRVTFESPTRETPA